MINYQYYIAGWLNKRCGWDPETGTYSTFPLDMPGEIGKIANLFTDGEYEKAVMLITAYDLEKSINDLP